MFAATAQTVSEDSAGTALQAPERTPQLEALYQQERYLAENGTAQEIEANRLAIKNAWTEIDPSIGDLYKPINAPLYGRVGEGPTPYVPAEILERPEPLPTTRDWGGDILIRDDFVDGIDMTATLNTGDLYVGMYENVIDFGGDEDLIFIYRSTDKGVTWEIFAETIAINPIRKIQLISLDGTGDQFILAYLMFENGLLQVLRWNTAGGPSSLGSVASDVADFAVDRNFPANTDGMRVLATYLKDSSCTTEIFSARSTAGQYGFGWVDEVSVDAVCGNQVDFTYARAGDTFTTYTGNASGNLYVNTNDAFNDPTSWTPRETVEFGNIRETINPTIRAARLELPDEKVVIWASDRADGSTGNYNGKAYLRESSSIFTEFSNFPSGGANWNIAHTDGWIRRTEGVETIRFSYVRDNIDNSENSVNRSITFNGTDFDGFEPVADSPVDVFDGFPSVMAETADEEPCMAFAGTNGGFGFGLYFDTRAEVVLATGENTIAGLTYFPNPTSDILNINANTNLDRVELYSITGAKVLNIQNNELTNTIAVNTSNLSAGIYVMTVTAGSQIGTYKVVKQ